MGSRRNFNGCWTCRIRKVKCDAGRPTCRRCVKANLKCEGYDIKLSFYQSLTIKHGQLVDIAVKREKEEKFSRRTMELSTFPSSSRYFTFDELNVRLDQLDKLVESGSYNISIGPFSVYEMSSKKDISFVLNHQKDPNAEIEVEYEDKELIHPDLIPLAKLSIYGIKGPDYIINDQNLYHITYPTFYPNTDSDDWVPDADILSKLIVPAKNGKFLTTSYLHIVSIFNQFKFLFQHVHQNNCWDLYISPYISKIMFDNVIYDYAKVSDFEPEQLDKDAHVLCIHIKYIINLLILSILYFHKSTTKFTISSNRDIDTDLKYSINLRKKALNLLNYHLDEYDNHIELNHQQYNFLLLLAIILQIEIDNYFSIFENFELLFTIGDIVAGEKGDDTKYVILRCLYNIMNIFFKSTLRINVYNYKMKEEDYARYRDLDDAYDLTKLTAMDDEDDDEDYEFENPQIIDTPYLFLDKKDHNDYTDDLGFAPECNKFTENSVYLMYGVPKSLLQMFDRIIELTNHKRVFHVDKRYPRNFPKICSEVEDKLEKWQCKWHLWDENGQYKSELHQQIHAHIRIFHDTLRVYYRRLIKNEVHQILINSVASSLEAFRKQNVVDLVFWILLVVHSDNSELSLTSALKMGEYRNLNYWRSKQVMIEIVKRRETDPISWMELIREWDVLLYLG